MCRKLWRSLDSPGTIDGPMTICFGALCAKEDGHASQVAVVASDRMVTLGGLIEFDHSAPKTTKLGPAAVGLIAGEALTGASLLRSVLEAHTSPETRVSELASTLAQTYRQLRLSRAESTFLLPRGLSLQTFYENQQKLLPPIVGQIDQQLLQFDLGVEILLVGVDDHGSHLFTVGNPGGQFLEHDVIGYAAIGSGALHALQAMIGFKHATSQDLNETVFRAYAAKRRAEVAPGVGRETDMLVIDSSGVCRLGADTLTELEQLYTVYTDSTEKNLGTKLSKLQLEQEAFDPA
jgi:ATP-dependent protease HslVU (ClpYQ) peptidase subunit